MKGVVIASILHVRSKPTVQSGVTGRKHLPKDTAIEWTETAQGDGQTWYKISDGYVAASWVKITDYMANTPAPAAKTGTDAKGNPTLNQYDNMLSAKEQGVMSVAGIFTNLMGLPIKSYDFIHGLPYKFTAITDRRLNNDNQEDFYGREYMDTIMSNIPVAVFTPCMPVILPGTVANDLKSFMMGKDPRNNLLAALTTSDTNAGISADIMSALSKDYLSYFSTETCFMPYMDYVNTMCRTSAIAAGLGDHVLNGVKLRNYDWGPQNKDAYRIQGASAPGPTKANLMGEIKNALGFDQSISFAFDPLSAVSNNVNNTTDNSALAGTLKGVSQKAREAEFLLGTTMGFDIGKSPASSESDFMFENIMPTMADANKNNVNSVWGRLKDGMNTLTTGSNFRMPEIWQDSSYGTSYSLTMKFRAAYGDIMSRYLDVLVPFWHVVALGFPRMFKPNAYSAPFIIRAYSKGYFNVEMGIVDSIQFSKFGDGEDISEDGIPLEIEVTLNFKDLYNSLGMTRFVNASAFFNNTGLLEFIGTTSGLNMNREDAAFAAQVMLDAAWNAGSSTPQYFYQSMRERVRNAMPKFGSGY